MELKRGQVHRLVLNLVKGREQTGARDVLIVSPREFNRLGAPLICPITQSGEFARHTGFAVPLAGSGAKTQGVVLCNQLRVLDLHARDAEYVETLPDSIMDDVLARLATILE